MIRRDWTLALGKVRGEARCRVCRKAGRLEAAHVVGRRYDAEREDGTIFVHPDDVVPLCGACHAAYDARSLDLLPYLSLAEQARAALHVGLLRAFSRTTSNANGPP